MRVPLTVLVAVLSACGSTRPKIDFDGLEENSGLVQRRQIPGQFWTHNDSTDGPCPGDARIFAMDREGQVNRVVTVLDSCNVDWEDIAIDDASNLYIGDFGNNDSARRDLTIYRLPEPAPGAHSVRPDLRVRFRFAEQSNFPDTARNFDVESLFWAPRAAGGGALYLLTKRRSDQRTVLYRFDELVGDREVIPVQIGSFTLGGDPQRFGGMATAADATPDGRYLAVLSYHAIFVFERPADGDNYLSNLVSRIDFDQDVTVQAEAIAWEGERLVFTNEGGAVFWIDDPLVSGTFPRD